MEKGGFEKNPFMRLTLAWTVVLLTGFWISNFFMYFGRMNLTPQSVADYYLGSEAAFTHARSAAAMWEVTHMHLPMMALVLLLLTHLLIFAPIPDNRKRWFISGAFASALFQEAAGWGVRFVHPGFAWLKIVSFLTLQGLMAYLLLGLGAHLWRAKRSRR